MFEKVVRLLASRCRWKKKNLFTAKSNYWVVLRAPSIIHQKVLGWPIPTYVSKAHIRGSRSFDIYRRRIHSSVFLSVSLDAPLCDELLGSKQGWRGWHSWDTNSRHDNARNLQHPDNFIDIAPARRLIYVTQIPVYFPKYVMWFCTLSLEVTLQGCLNRTLDIRRDLIQLSNISWLLSSGHETSRWNEDKYKSTNTLHQIFLFFKTI